LFDLSSLRGLALSLTDHELRERTAAKRYNLCLALIADTWNTLVLAVLIATIVTPIVEAKDALAAFTPLNGVIAFWCFVLHLFGYIVLRMSKAE
jgi:hypothetical protein